VLAAVAHGAGGTVPALGPLSLAELELVGHVGGAVRAVVVEEGRAWMGQGVGVTEVDLTAPDDARETWRLVLGAHADVWSLARVGTFLAVGASDGVYLVDHAAHEPRVLARLPLERPVRALTALGPDRNGALYVLAVTPGHDAAVIAVSTDGTASVVAEVPDSAGATTGIAVDGARGLFAGRELRVLDLSDPAAPTVVATAAVSGTVRGLAAAGGFGYVADSRDGLLVLALDDPGAPVGRLSGVRAGRLILRGHIAFLLEEHATGPNTVRLVDVADPASPRDVLGGESTYEVLRGALDLACAADVCAAARGRGLVVADVRDVRWPLPRSEVASTWPVAGIAPAGGCVYAALGENGLGVIDVRVREAPLPWAGWRPVGGVDGVHVSDGHAYVSAANGFSRIDVSDPCDPVPRETPFAADWPATAWIASGGRLLAATTTTQLRLAALGVDRAPEETAAIQYAALPGWPGQAVAQGIAMGEDAVAFVAAGPGGVAVMGLEDPSAPRLLRVLPPPEGAAVLSVALAGRQLAAGTSAGVLLYDAQEPATPRLVGAHAGHYSARSLAYHGPRTLLVAADEGGLLVLDVSDPARPAQRTAWRPPYAVSVVAVGADEGGAEDEALVLVAGAGLGVMRLRASGDTPTPPASDTPPPAEPSPTAARPWRDSVAFVPALAKGWAHQR